MAMDKTILAGLVVTALSGVVVMTPDQQAQAIQRFEVMFDELIKHMITNAEITIPVGFVSVGSSPAVTPNPAPIVMTGPAGGVTA